MSTRIKYLTEGKEGDVFYPFTHSRGVIVEGEGNLEAALANRASVSDVNSKAPINSPVLMGVPQAPTASTQTSTTQIATTQFVQQEIDRRASDFSFTVGSGNFVLATVESLTSIL